MNYGFGKYALAMNCFYSNFALLVISCSDDMFNQVDMTALKQMGENDLKELGIPMVINYLSFHIYSDVIQ